MKLTNSQIGYLSRQLSLLIHAGIGLADGILLLAEDETAPVSDLLRDLGAKMDEGAQLSEAMDGTDAFPGCVTGMIRIGEQTGRMEEVLTSLAQFDEQRSRNDRRIRQALTYPAVIMALMLVVIGVLLVKVLPVFEDVYASLGSRLTGVAAGLLYLGQILKASLPALLIVLAIVALCLRCAPVRQRIRGWLTVRFGDAGVARKFNNAHFARALAMGLASALPLEDAVQQAGKLLADVPAAKRCENCADLLKNGASLAEAMGSSGFLPPAESRMLTVGLREGSADRVMADIADRLMEEATDALEDAVSKVEPAMVLAASALVGVILLSVMLPLMNIMAVIG